MEQFCSAMQTEPCVQNHEWISKVFCTSPTPCHQWMPTWSDTEVLQLIKSLEEVQEQGWHYRGWCLEPQILHITSLLQSSIRPLWMDRFLASTPSKYEYYHYGHWRILIEFNSLYHEGTIVNSSYTVNRITYYVFSTSYIAAVSYMCQTLVPAFGSLTRVSDACCVILDMQELYI